MDKTYYLETAPLSWSGQRQMHAAGCALMPAKDQVKPLGRVTRAVQAMQEARRIHRKAFGCHHCCKA